MLALLVLFSAIVLNEVHGDVYMHSCRGSNNRMNGAGRNRRNARRMFDSQNNNRGGYNSGPGLKYYVGSKLMIEYWSQHTCGERNANCEIILQYMCHDKLRDGTESKTIPQDVDDDKCADDNCDTDYNYGMHETHDYYERCRMTSRNKRLYTSNQLHRGRDTAQFTRQDNQGTRYGLECPEERDYYPYWGPSPWKDIAVLTGDLSRCPYYQENSQNQKERFYCEPPAGYIEHLRKISDIPNDRHRRKKPIPADKAIPITREECEAIRTPGSNSSLGGVWTRVAPHNIDPPECVQAQPSRDNHNGNGAFGQLNNFNWTVPNDPNLHCTFRMRYNISTNDFEAWDSSARDNYNPDLTVNLGMHPRTAQLKGYYFKGNPIVQPFRVLERGQDTGGKFKLRLAMNTDQFGRTFQDRCHAFSIIPRPADVPSDALIWNIGVRGKRGNIVQTYPGLEYDFVPTRLIVVSGTYVHIQWTGSDNNPRNNAGEGTAGTDRNNMCLMGASNNPSEPDTKAHIYGRYGVSKPADLRDGVNIFNFDDIKTKLLCSAGAINGDNGNGQLNEVFRYFDLGLAIVQCNTTTVWHYMCTRNNNFTNRSQKGRLTCVPEETAGPGGVTDVSSGDTSNDQSEESAGNADASIDDTLSDLESTLESTSW